MQVLKTLQWNIGGGRSCEPADDALQRGSYDRDGLAGIVALIQNEDPDIVTLQETHLSADCCQARLIAENTPCRYWVNDSYADSHIERGQRLGQAILSRWPIDSHVVTSIPNPNFAVIDESGTVLRSHDRVLTTCRQRLPDGQDLQTDTFHMTPFHFFDIDSRSERAHRVIGEVEALLLGGAAVRRLVQADFNLDTATLEDFFPLLPEMSLNEVVQELPTTPKGRRLDHILYGGMRLLESHVRDDALTDHFPVASTFAL